MPATEVRPGDVERTAVRAVDGAAIQARIDEILNRWPAVGLAVGVVRNGQLESFHGHGLADIETHAPVTEDTVFRIGSVAKTFTAIAVMQLWERGLIDLDTPANDYLRGYRLVPTDPSFGPATIRHLLTHTAGIPDVVHIADLLHPGWGAFGMRPAAHSVELGARLPSLAEYYRGSLRIVAEPGTVFAYTGHGFATLGQIVEDVSGTPLEVYLRRNIFEPLGMTNTDLERTGRIEAHLARGYDLRRGGASAVIDREWVGRAAGGIYSSTRDMARYAAALLGEGSNEHGTILHSPTLAAMFDPHFRPDPRLPGMGLGFFRSSVGQHRLVEHDGRLPGFNTTLIVAPDDGLGLVVSSNGTRGGYAWMPIEFERLIGDLLSAPHDDLRTDLPHHPEVWDALCGRYGLPPKVSDLRGRMSMAGGFEVFVGDGRLKLRLLAPLPALRRGVPLVPDDPDDPYAYRLDLTRWGMPTVRAVFSPPVGGESGAIHTDLAMQSLYRRPATPTAQRVALAGAVASLTLPALRRRRRKKTTRWPIPNCGA